jgi:DNA-binding response OmpR family regulator
MQNESARAARILIVDDDQDTAAILAYHLRHEGFVPIAVNSGPECLKLAQLQDIDVILMDLMMPDMDGFQVVRALKNSPATADIPIIMITARDDLDAREEGMRLGVSDFLAKPVYRRQLATRVRAQLEVVATARRIDAALDSLQAVKHR